MPFSPDLVRAQIDGANRNYHQHRSFTLQCTLKTAYDLKTSPCSSHRNPTVFEWFSSPIIYKQTDFVKKFKPILHHYFSSKSGLWHYLHMAEGNYREYLQGDMVKAKKYFYVLRPILACRWILEKQVPPPMRFSELVESQLDRSIKAEVAELLELKMNVPEVKMIPRIDKINKYLDDSIREVRETIRQMPPEEIQSWDELDALFLSELGK